MTLLEIPGAIRISGWYIYTPTGLDLNANKDLKPGSHVKVIKRIAKGKKENKDKDIYQVEDEEGYVYNVFRGSLRR